MGDVGPTIAHNGRALLRHIVSKFPKPIVPCLSGVVMRCSLSLGACVGGTLAAGEYPAT